MALQKQVLQVSFDGADQRTGEKHLQAGRLTLAQNVYQDKIKEYRKRNGYSNLVRTADYDESGATASNITTGTGLASGPSSGLVLRADKTAYAFDATANEWQTRGSADRVFPTITRAMPNAGITPQIAIDASNNAVIFGEYPNGDVYFSVVDLNTGLLTIQASKLNLSFVGTRRFLKTISVGGNIWLISYDPGLAGGTLASWKIEPTKYRDYASGTVPTKTAISTLGAATVEGIDVASSTSGVLIMAYGSNPVHVLFMDTSTGGLLAVPGLVSVTGVGGSGNAKFGFWARNDTTTNCFGVVMRESGGNVAWQAFKLNPSTLATVSNEQSWDTGTTAVFPEEFSLSGGGYVDGAGKLTFIASKHDNKAEDGVLGLVSTSFAGATVTDNFLRASWMASEIFKVGTDLYYMTAHDDNPNATPTDTSAKLQQAYYMRRLTFWDGTEKGTDIVSSVLYGRGGPLGYNPSLLRFKNGGPAFVYVSGTKARMVVSELNNQVAYTATLVDWETNDTTIGPPVGCAESTIFPGGWPQHIIGGRMSEISPPMFPRTVTMVDAGAGSMPAGNYSAQAIYVVRDQDGRAYRSSPSTLETITQGASRAITISVPSLRIQTPNPFPGIPASRTAVRVDVEFYLTEVDKTTLRLVDIQKNDETADTTSSAVISTEPDPESEILYTTGGLISNSPLPPFRWASCWRDRVIVGGTPVKGQVWASHPITNEGGAEFNEFNIFLVPGRDYAGAPVDNNYFAVFTADAVHVISGDGPDRQGRNVYKPLKLSGTVGCTNPNSIATSPQGLYYQGTDGNIYLLTPSLEQMEISDGVFDFVSETVTAAITETKAQQVRFYTDNSKVLVWDYGNRSEKDPRGQWYVWTLGAGAIGATMHNGVAHHIAADATVSKEVAGQYFDGTSTVVLPKLKLAPISFSGLQGFERVWRMQFLGQFKGNHTIKITFDRNYGEATEVFSKAIVAGPQELEIRPAVQRVKSLGVTIEQTGSDLTEAFVFESIAFELGIYGALRPIDSARRM